MAFVAVLPLALVTCVIVAQAAVAGYAAWSAAGAARAGARAELVGAPVAAAARGALPESLADRARIRRDGGGEGGEVEVEISTPRLLPMIPKLAVSAAAALPVEEAAGG